MVRTRNLNMNVYHVGKQVPQAVVAEKFGLLDDIEAGYNQWKSVERRDDNLLRVFERIFEQKSLELSPEQEAAFAAILFGEIVEDWTAPLHELSAGRHCEYDSVDGVGSDWRVVEGMECIDQQILDPNFQNLRLNHHVKSVRFDSDSMLVHVHGDGFKDFLKGRVAVFGVPLGELRERQVEVEPLPDWKREAWKELGLGRAIRVALEFEKHFWPSEVEFFMDFVTNCTSSFLQDVDLCSIEFTAPVGVSGTYPPALVAEADGRLAERLSNQSNDAVVQFLLGRLEEMFGNLPELKSSHVLRPWGLPFWQQGSSGRPAARRAGEPIMKRLFFAGDYVSHNVGTVAGAFLSGIAAAHAVSCELGAGGLIFEELPTIGPMIDKACSERTLLERGRCNVTLWDVLYSCSALRSLDDESGRTCFVQGHDRWREESVTWWLKDWRRSVRKSAQRLVERVRTLYKLVRGDRLGKIRTEV